MQSHGGMTTHFQEQGVVGRVAEDSDRLVVLGPSAQHGGATDVDVLDQFVARDVGVGRHQLERVEVHDNQIDTLDAVLLQEVQVYPVVALVEDARMDLRAEGFYPTIQTLGEARDLGHVGDRDVLLTQELGGTARTEDLPAEVHQGLGQFHYTGLVEHTDQRSGHGHLLITG
ncbi:MAG: hypothetical protein US42_C0001G0057 [Candidatus Magasanikbacteria bacterium GW2011_GWC2_37_14]|uniref:Uncharacterized protein n=1 Tax=Candidatus Magasanikbacteria bacterium GW2011_GWC2_37_14 TaxID=1619046 RepID=A0A0G0JJG1_9BACT|nr:MAG: hypothetical protein US42_C0001G0057 [Candidatus Magasanikbacteria bacterium GW2011_GWC2_37_14]